jgi:hypothetical protein
MAGGSLAEDGGLQEQAALVERELLDCLAFQGFACRPTTAPFTLFAFRSTHGQE